jgi:hypothetical protein
MPFSFHKPGALPRAIMSLRFQRTKAGAITNVEKPKILRLKRVAHSGILFIACVEFENHELGIFL